VLDASAEISWYLHALCSVFIELVRGLPLIPVLFMAELLFPLFQPLALRAVTGAGQQLHCHNPGRLAGHRGQPLCVDRFAFAGPRRRR